MDDNERSAFQSHFREMHQSALLKHLAQGEGEFQAGVYDLLMAEVSSRGLTPEMIVAKKQEIKTEEKRDRVNRDIVIGYICSTALLGIPGIVIGTRLIRTGSSKGLANGIVITILGGLTSIGLLYGVGILISSLLR